MTRDSFVIQLHIRGPAKPTSANRPIGRPQRTQSAALKVSGTLIILQHFGDAPLGARSTVPR
jgi:hypothetical protein